MGTSDGATCIPDQQSGNEYSSNRENDNELIYSFKTSEMHVESEEEVPWTLDGEFGGSHTDLTITNLSKQITIMC